MSTKVQNRAELLVRKEQLERKIRVYTIQRDYSLQLALECEPNECGICRSEYERFAQTVKDLRAELCVVLEALL